MKRTSKGAAKGATSAAAEAEPDLLLLGQRIRTARERAGMTLEGLAVSTGLTKGLLSKIENYRTTPSLSVLIRIAQGLGVDVSELVRDLGRSATASYTVVRRDEGTRVQREEGIGFLYRHMVGRFLGDLSFEAFHLTLAPGAKRRAVTTDGDEYLYVLSGQVTLVLGRERVELSAGDSVFFNGRLPHVPENHGSGPSQMLVVYLLPRTVS